MSALVVFVLLSYNVFAATHSGTTYTTVYDKAYFDENMLLTKVYPAKSGSIGLYEKDTDRDGSQILKYHGNVAGNVKIISFDKEYSTFKLSVTPLPSAKVPTPKAVYFNIYGPGGKAIALKSDNIILEETYFEPLKAYRTKAKSKGGILYQEDADVVVYCKDCTFEYDKYFGKFHIIGRAVAMSRSNYERLEKQLSSSRDPVSVAKSKLKEWEYLELKDLKWMEFIKPVELTYPYKEIDAAVSNKVNEQIIKYVPTFRIKAVAGSKGSAIGKIKMRSYNYVAVEVSKSLFYDDDEPGKENYAFYALKGSGVLYDFPSMMYFQHTGIKSTSTGLPTILYNGNNYMYLYGENFLGLMKNSKGEIKNLFYDTTKLIYDDTGKSFTAFIEDKSLVKLSVPVQTSYPSELNVVYSDGADSKFTLTKKFKRVVGRDIARSIVFNNCKMQLPNDVPWYDYGMNIHLSCIDYILKCTASSKECTDNPGPSSVVNSLPGAVIQK